VICVLTVLHSACKTLRCRLSNTLADMHVGLCQPNGTLMSAKLDLLRYGLYAWVFLFYARVLGGACNMKNVLNKKWQLFAKTFIPQDGGIFSTILFSASLSTLGVERLQHRRVADHRKHLERVSLTAEAAKFTASRLYSSGRWSASLFSRLQVRRVRLNALQLSLLCERIANLDSI